MAKETKIVLDPSEELKSEEALQSAGIVPLVIEDDRTGMSKESFRRAFLDHLKCSLGTDPAHATPWDHFMALSYTVRDRLVHRWIKTRYSVLEHQAKFVCYLSAEFLMGRQLANNLLNIGYFKTARDALADLDIDLYQVLDQESEPGLGNGGLGRLAACYLDSLATLDIPAIGYGIRYEFGIFQQEIRDGWQVERPDKWLRLGSPWDMPRPQLTVEVGFGGRCESYRDESGYSRRLWIPERTVLGIPHDVMVPGFGTNTVNTLRLWAAGTTRDFDFEIFNAGDYTRAVADKTFSENISKVLYPNDNTPQGRELRLQQQYFFVSCSLKNMIRRHLARARNLDNFHELTAIQLNDTHPAVAVAELMRLLVDIYRFDWDRAWHVTTNTFAFTNHTLLPEALERWPVKLFGDLLPRHLEIIYEINQRFLEDIRKRYPHDDGRVGRLSIIEEGDDKKVRMAHLATVGSHAVNGVAELHTQLIKSHLLKDFYELWPEKFSNKTNGITPRRWLMLSNPKLTYLITEKIGKGWLRDLRELKRLEEFADERAFREVWRTFKEQNKGDLAQYIQGRNGVKVDPTSLFDVQVKRLHEYKRQLLAVLEIIAIYLRLKSRTHFDYYPRTFIFGAKAAPGYYMAKLIIKLINSVADVVNNDHEIGDQLKVVFLENFCVTLGERVYPAADLSEQISLAGKEASGTGNMKFALNGALTIGTLDGANIEIREAVGEDNFFLFGLTVDRVEQLRARGYRARDIYESDPELRRVLDSLVDGTFAGGDEELFRPIFDSLVNRDEYMHLADFRSYSECHQRVSRAYQDKDHWVKMSILNVARMGYFSSDRAINEYCREIWKVEPISVKV